MDQIVPGAKLEDFASEAATKEKIDETDVVIIGPFDSDKRREFAQFRAKIIDPALEQAKEHCRTNFEGTAAEVTVVELNPLAADSQRLDDAYRVLHLAGLCVADATHYDPRAMYFLGMRLALSKGRTIALVRDKNDKARLPIPVKDVVCDAWEGHEEDALQAVRDAAIAAMTPDAPVQSPVFSRLPALRVDLGGSPRKEGAAASCRDFRLHGSVAGSRITIAIGDLRKVKDFDVWVNPENTLMEMARVFDTSVSGTIRHMSSNWSGSRSDEFIRRRLASAVFSDTLREGQAVLTECSGKMRKENRVKRVVHVAAVKLIGAGGAGCGYEPVSDVGLCVTNALGEVVKHNRMLNTVRLRSVLFPLMGTSASPHVADKNVATMLDAVIAFLKRKPDHIERVALLGYSDEDARLIQKAVSRRLQDNTLEEDRAKPHKA